MPSIEFYVNGQANDRAGNRYQLAGYSVQEDSTPLNVGDSSGGTGQLSLDVVDEASGIELLFDREVEISDGFNGRFSGHVNSISSERGIATLTIDSLQNRLIGDTMVPPFQGRLDAAIRFYCSFAGIPSNKIFVDGSIATRQVYYAGWRGSIWAKLKELMAVEQIELSEVSSQIVVRPVRQRQMERSTDARVTWGLESQDAALWVEVYNYNSYYSPNGIVYGTDDSAVSVQAGETTILSPNIEASLMTVAQPIPVDFDAVQTTTASTYKIIDKDGEPIPAQEWINRGGRVEVAIGADSSSLVILVTGAQLPNGPFRLAHTDTAGDTAGSMIIVGAGVFYQKELIRVRTGAPADRVTREVGATIDSPFISDASKAYSVIYALASAFAGPSMSVSTDLVVANREGESGVVSAVTFGEFNQLYAGRTFAQFNATWAGKTFGDVTDFLLALKGEQFNNQAFGNVAGSRFKHRDAMYRVRSATIGPASIRANAEPDTTVGDFNNALAGMTFAQFNSLWQNRNYNDLTLRPLRTE